MAPTTEQLILSELKAFRAEQNKQGQDIAAIKSTIAAEQRFCGDCKTAINKDIEAANKDIEGLFGRIRNVELQGAAHDGADEAKGKTNTDKKDRTTLYVALIAAAGAWAAVFIK